MKTGQVSLFFEMRSDEKASRGSSRYEAPLQSKKNVLINCLTP
jgi:hypothetical protein